MKVAARDVAAFCARPDRSVAGILIHGGDAMRVSLRRAELVSALAGRDAEGEMRIVRLAPADLRDDPARIGDELRARGFFDGPRVVVFEGAADAQNKAVATALDGWQDGDATLVVTAGALSARSSLRKLFEGGKALAALPVYDDPPGRDEVRDLLDRHGLSDRSGDADAALAALAETLTPGEFAQFAERLALYMHGADAALEAADVAAVAPVSSEAAVDAAVEAAADGEVAAIGPLVRRLEAQGATPVGICIAAARHFRSLFAVASDPAGPATAVARLRPPVWGRRRERMQAQAQRWNVRRLDAAIQLLVDTDLALRSSSPAPQMALIERALVRLAMLGRQ